MHEYSIIQSLVDSVESAVLRANAAGKKSVHRIEVQIGEVSGVDCGLLATAFEVFRAGTICERAEMRIERTPALWQCPKCSAAIEKGSMLRCRNCNEPAHLATGDEIILKRIELEVA